MTTRRQQLYENSQRNRRVAYNSYRYGWPVDQKKHAEIALVVQRYIDEAEAGLRAALAEVKEAYTDGDPKLAEFLDKFNAGSNQQVGRLFYDILEEPIKFRTKQGSPGTGKAALEHIVRYGGEHAQHIAKLLKKHKVNTKLQDAYIKGLSGVNLVRPAAHVTSVLTGRWAYRDPAIQTVPSYIKPMFIAHPGTWIVACDLAGAELRSFALQSGCQEMLDAFNSGQDLHWRTAQILFGLPIEKMDKNIHRKIAKPVGLGYQYSVLDNEGAAAGLYQQVGHLSKALTFELVLGALERLDEARPEMRQYKERLLEQALKTDYVAELLHHRRRYFYDKVKSTEVFNFPQQSFIAALMDKALQGIDSEFISGEGLLMNRHDEGMICGPDPIRLCRLFWKHMRQTHTIKGNRITFEIEYKIFKRWGRGVTIEPKKLGTEFEVSCGGCLDAAERLYCQHKNVHATLESAVEDACKHYDSCAAQGADDYV